MNDDKDSILSKLVIGKYLKVETIHEEEFEGSVYCFDNLLGVVIFKIGDRGNKEDLSVIRTDGIKHVEILSDAPPQFCPPQHLRPMDPEVAEKRMRAAEEKRARELKNIGQKVSPKARRLFDVLSKTMDCVWNGDSILVMGAVKVVSPYGPENCVGSNPREVS